MRAPITSPAAAKKQHLIDPEICIRCNTCEETCPVGAVTHDANNYVVDPDKCDYCLDCIQPCPTGSIDNWRMVAGAYSIEAQFGWTELPPQADVGVGDEGEHEADDEDAARLIAEAHLGAGGKSVPPASAGKPKVNLYNRARPATATVSGNYRLTAADADNDVRHIILDFGDTLFPVLEGQTIGIVPPGSNGGGKPHKMRLYSVASPRDGEKPNTNNLSLTVKREKAGVCSNYVCDLKKGDKVQVAGPFGATFLMPDDPAANILMICTGTGAAPFRGFTERRRRTMREAYPHFQAEWAPVSRPQSAPTQDSEARSDAKPVPTFAERASGRMMLFFGARRPEELPYFGPLQKVPDGLLRKHFAYSRIPGEPKTYVQQRMREKAGEVAAFLKSPQTHVYLCGLRGMESGVDEAFADICKGAGLDWPKLRAEMRAGGRYHVETY
jgi:benzoyl-CoA 2,3-dioxygenase component A